MLVRPAAYPVAESLLEEILDRFAPALEGKRVLVKPNCVTAAAPERAVTTHPSLVRGLVTCLGRRGAKVTVGDNPGFRRYGSARPCFEAAGLLRAAGEAYRDIGAATVPVALASRIAERAVVSREVLEADYLVTAPKLKTHCLTTLTGAVKNSYGILAGAEKARLHWEARTAERFAEVLADVFAVRRPDLAVMDAVVAMEGDGPSHGDPRALGVLIASDDAVAADATAARLVGLRPERVAHLRVAAARGLGAIAREAILLDGELRPVRGFRLPSTARTGLLSAVSNLLVFNVLHRSPLRVDVRKCRRCAHCVSACPAGAIGERDGRYGIDTARCQRCFCCAELCPEGAVRVQGALGALVRRGRRG